MHLSEDGEDVQDEDDSSWKNGELLISWKQFLQFQLKFETLFTILPTLIQNRDGFKGEGGQIQN